jgi:adenosine deaminase
MTVCPLSNVKLGVFDTLKQHNLKRMLDLGLNVSIHSDDPAYFGGYITQNYLAAIDALDMNESDIMCLATNARRVTELQCVSSCVMQHTAWPLHLTQRTKYE